MLRPFPPPQALLLFAIFMLFLGHHHAADCPSACSCIWKRGKRTVECNDKGLSAIPDGLDPATQGLEFSGNNLGALRRDTFLRVGIINLQRIHLARCRIAQIDDRALRGLAILVDLDLSQNQLRFVPTAAFSDCPSLLWLALNGNPIRAVEAGAFSSLRLLKTIELSDCEIERLEPGAFSGLDNLRRLELDGNRLKKIGGADTLPSNLWEISLQQNPWQCDCQLTDLTAWMVKNKIPQAEEPKCTTPVWLEGEFVKTLDLNNLTCLTDISTKTLYLETADGKNVSVLCRVSAILSTRLSRWLQGRTLQNDSLVAPGVHLYYFAEEGTQDKKSESFSISTEENDTFFCDAENSAGKSHHSYTIRVIVREEPIIEPLPLPNDYVITIACSISLMVLLLVIATVYN